MKKKLKVISGLSLFIALLIPCSGAVGNIGSSQQTVETALPVSITTPGNSLIYQKAAENNHLTLYINRSKGFIKLINKADSSVWGSTPDDYQSDTSNNKSLMQSQLVVIYLDNNHVLQTIYSRHADLEIQTLANGVRTIYNFEDTGFTIPVDYTITESAFSARIESKNIKETDSDYHIVQVGILPYFGSGSTSDSGYMVVPDGCGALINFNNQKSQYGDYNQDVYDSDQSIDVKQQTKKLQVARLPIFGVKKNQSAFLAVITQGDSRAIVDAAVSSSMTRYNNIYSEFIYRNTCNEEIKGNGWDSRTITVAENNPSTQDYVVDYYFLSGSHADYTGMALQYQKYLRSEKGLKKEVASNDYPFYVELFGGIKKTQNFLGFPIKKVLPLTNFNDVADIASRLKKSGVDNLVLKYDYWTKGCTDSPITVNMKSDGALGSGQSFRNMLQSLNEQKVKAYLNVNLTDIVKSRWGYSKTFESAQTIYKTSSIQHYFTLSTGQISSDYCNLLKPTKVLSAASAISQNEIQNLYGYSCDSLSNKLYSDFPAGIGREKAEQYWIDSLKLLGKNKKVLLSEPNAFMLPYASNIQSLPTDSSNYLIEDESIPFYQIALHGYVSYSVPAVNLNGDLKQQFLKALETGSSLNFEWAQRNYDQIYSTDYSDLYSISIDDWYGDAVHYYMEARQVLAKVSDQPITAHQYLVADVTKTTFGDGSSILINYNDHPIMIGNITVAADSYKVLGKDEK